MLLSVTYINHPDEYVKKSNLFKLNCGGPNTFYLQNELDYIPDYTSMKYNGEKYIYQFIFYDFSEDSVLRRIFFELVTDETVSFYEKNQCCVLSNKELDFYNYETESVYDGDIELGGDEIGGALCCGIII